MVNKALTNLLRQLFELLSPEGQLLNRFSLQQSSIFFVWEPSRTTWGFIELFFYVSTLVFHLFQPEKKPPTSPTTTTTTTTQRRHFQRNNSESGHSGQSGHSGGGGELFTTLHIPHTSTTSQMDELCTSLPTVTEFPRQQLRLLEKLGEGAFGMVRIT